MIFLIKHVSQCQIRKKQAVKKHRISKNSLLPIADEGSVLCCLHRQCLLTLQPPQPGSAVDTSLPLHRLLGQAHAGARSLHRHVPMQLTTLISAIHVF